MNRYVVKATGQVLAVLAFAAVCAAVFSGILRYFDPTPTQLVIGLMLGLLVVSFYNLVKIQASILENRDKLNREE